MRRRLAVLALLGAALAPAAGAAPPRDPMDAARALDDARWEERRRAEADLVALGHDALAERGEAAAERLKAWDAALLRAERDGGPGAAEAVARVLRRLERDLDDEGVRRSPRLLRARLERLVPRLVGGPEGEDRDAWARGRLAWPAVMASIRRLMPEARPALIELVRAAQDPRTLAGALVATADARRPEDDDLLAAIGDAWDADPDRIAAASRLPPQGRQPPLVTVALALALTGRASELPRLRRRLETDTLGAFGNALRARLPARGDGDLAIGSFVARVEEGSAVADDQAEAARRALAADLPWLARLLARRALFLSPRHEAARTTLVKADEALGLAATARRDGGLPPEGGVADDRDAAETDASLRAGRLSQRLLFRFEAGTDEQRGLAPVAVGDGVLVVGTTRGMVDLVDAETGRVLSMDRTGVGRLPRDLAVAGGVVAGLTGRGGVLYWRVEPEGLRRVGLAAGPFVAVAAGADGTFWFLGAQRALARADGPSEPQPVAGLERLRGFTPTAFAVLGDGALLIAGGGSVVRFEPATGKTTTLAQGDADALRAAAYGRGAVVAHGEVFDVLSETGARTGGGHLPEGSRITGVAGDPATGTVYVATAESLAACAAADGAVRWVESVEGSGNPALGRGLVAVSAGLGTEEGGDGRLDRTVSVLRAGIDRRDPFAAEARVRAVEAAVAAAREGRPAVARALLDPVAAWLTPSEAWAADQALRELDPHPPDAPASK